MRCGLRILQLQKRFFMLLLFNVQLFIFFDAINRSISLRAKLYFTIWKLQHITLVREKGLKSPHLFSSISPYQTACSDFRSRGPTSIRRGTPWKRKMIDTFRNQRRLIARAWTNCGFNTFNSQ